MLLTGFSGIDLVQFLYRNFIYQSLHFFLFFSFLPLSVCLQKKFFFETKSYQDKLCGNQDVKSNTTSAKNYDTCAHE